jgi:hypothetical protein
MVCQNVPGAAGPPATKLYAESVACWAGQSRGAGPRGADGGAVVMNILEIEPRTALYQHAHDIEMPCQRGLVQWGGMRMKSHRVVPIRIFSRIQQELHNFDTSVLACESECNVPRFGRGAPQLLADNVHSPHRCGGREIELRSATL